MIINEQTLSEMQYNVILDPEDSTKRKIEGKHPSLKIYYDSEVDKPSGFRAISNIDKFIDTISPLRDTFTGEDLDKLFTNELDWKYDDTFMDGTYYAFKSILPITICEQDGNYVLTHPETFINKLLNVKVISHGIDGHSLNYLKKYAEANYNKWITDFYSRL